MYFVRAACDPVIRLNDVFFVVVFFLITQQVCHYYFFLPFANIVCLHLVATTLNSPSCVNRQDLPQRKWNKYILKTVVYMQRRL